MLTIAGMAVKAISPKFVRMRDLALAVVKTVRTDRYVRIMSFAESLIFDYDTGSNRPQPYDLAEADP
jgi:hypothetical protein